MQIDLKQPILQKNDAIASELRERFAETVSYTHLTLPTILLV